MSADLPLKVATIATCDGEVRVTLDRRLGVPIVDVRSFEPFTPARVKMATRKGISLSLSCLPALLEALADAEEKARELGLLDG